MITSKQLYYMELVAVRTFRPGRPQQNAEWVLLQSTNVGVGVHMCMLQKGLN